jgi:hypothetical protein
MLLIKIRLNEVSVEDSSEATVDLDVGFLGSNPDTVTSGQQERNGHRRAVSVVTVDICLRKPVTVHFNLQTK